jgi:hypothetical protein
VPVIFSKNDFRFIDAVDFEKTDTVRLAVPGERIEALYGFEAEARYQRVSYLHEYGHPRR